MLSLEDLCCVRLLLREELARFHSASKSTAGPCTNCSSGTDRTEALLSVKEGARLAGVRPETIRRWVKDGKLRRFAAGRRVRVSRDDLMSYLARAIDGEEGFDEDAQVERMINNMKK